jgi:hypothetical protein
VTPAGVLRGAAATISDRGWRTGPPRPGDRTVCALDAIWVQPASAAARSDAESALSGWVGSTVAAWNDTSGRRADDVTSTMLTVAAAMDSDLPDPESGDVNPVTPHERTTP